MARRTTPNTRGQRQLRRYLGRTSQAALAAKIGVGQQTISEWASGKCRPDSVYRLVLQGVTGIPSDAWFDAHERRRIARALRQPAAA